MMGVQKAAAQLFCVFDLEGHIPANHLLREIDRFLDMDGPRETLQPFYSHTGRPSIDPELILRMLVMGQVVGIRPERRLCQDVAHRWFRRRGLDDKVPELPAACAGNHHPDGSQADHALTIKLDHPD